MDNTIAILEARFEEALEALRKLARKAERYRTPPIRWTVGEPRFETRYDEGNRPYKVQVRDLTFESLEPPRVGNFTFIAKLEITQSGVIIDSIPGEELPEHFRHSDGECEHCRQNRYRAHLFVVRSPEGELVQVGRTCLRDYMGTDTPASVAARFRFIREAAEWSEEFCRSGPTYDRADELLAVTSTAIRLWGWVPKSAPESAGTPTAYRISAWFNLVPGDKIRKADHDALKAAICEEDWEAAEAAIAWVMSNGDNSEYMHNLRVVLAPGMIPLERRGLACSAMSGYQRYLGKLASQKAEKAAALESKHVGAVNERLKGITVTCLGGKGFQGDFGLTILYKFKDSDGNLYSWFSSGGADLSSGKTYEVDATVKAHRVFNGILETQLTRVKVQHGHR